MILGKMVQERMALCLMTSLFLIQTAPARGGDWVTNLKARWHNHQGGASAEALAGEIEKLEKHIDGYGTIVAKQPDVWGQARLMKHRAEFEQQLSARLGSFKDTLQGSISRSDQAFLASAFSLSAAVSGAPAVQLPQTASISNEIATRQKAALNDAGVTSPTSSQLSGVTSPTTISPPTSNSSSGLTDNFDTTGVIQRTTINNLDTGVKFPSGSTIALEPTEELDQLATYINHLHQLRRLNEGDDVSASPGYALQLVRIPVSILPGSKTRKGYGAEITVTATPYLGRDLLPSTFRNLVINDLVEQNSTLLLEFFNSLSSRQDFVKVRQDLIKAVDSTNYSSLDVEPVRLSILPERRTRRGQGDGAVAQGRNSGCGSATSLGRGRPGDPSSLANTNIAGSAGRKGFDRLGKVERSLEDQQVQSNLRESQDKLQSREIERSCSLEHGRSGPGHEHRRVGRREGNDGSIAEDDRTNQHRQATDGGEQRRSGDAIAERPLCVSFHAIGRNLWWGTDPSRGLSGL
jgi:hypothetical protein